MKKLTSILATTAMLGLASVPASVNASTRAGDSQAAYSAPASAPGMSRSAKGSKVDQTEIILGVLSAAAVIGGVIILSNGGQRQSPGT